MTEVNKDESLNPHYGKVIGFVDRAGELVVDNNDNLDFFNLLINAGSLDDVKVGERVLVFALGPEMTDPESGESLGCFEVVRGQGKVSSVQTKMAVVHSTRTRTVSFKRQQNVAAIVAGTPPEVTFREEAAPFTKAKIGDLVRFF